MPDPTQLSDDEYDNLYESIDKQPTEETITYSEMQNILETMQLEFAIRRDALAFALSNAANIADTEKILIRAKAFEEFLLHGKIATE